jgi:hypothetical protein
MEASSPYLNRPLRSLEELTAICREHSNAKALVELDARWRAETKRLMAKSKAGALAAVTP